MFYNILYICIIININVNIMDNSLTVDGSLMWVMLPIMCIVYYLTYKAIRKLLGK